MSCMLRSLIPLLVVALVLPGVVLAQDSTPEMPDPEAIAQALIDHLLAGNFVAASADFSDEVAAALPPEKFEQTWESIIQQVGPFQEQLGTSREVLDDGSTRVIVTLQFERLAVDALIVIDAQGRVTGLFFGQSQSVPAPEPPPYEAPAYVDPAAFEERDVTITTGDWALPGTLTLPAGEGPFPGVVLVHGSGPNDRDESSGPNKPFRDLAWGLASQGIAVLRYDKRTLVYGAESAADPQQATVRDETIDDALTALELLRQTEGVDPDSVFLLGHSLGGYLAPWIASETDDLAGIIIAAGNTRSLQDLLVEQTEYLLTLDGELSESDQAQLNEVIALVDTINGLQPGDQPGESLLGAPAAYWLDLSNYQPVETAQALTLPVLIVQGERDYQVTMQDFENWRAGLEDHENVTFISYPNLNHLLMPGEGPASPAEYNLPEHVSEELVNDVAAWIKTHSRIS
ncbi:MAG: alpha/beta fold hydrolase [Chloroflexi bacterium]|nr:alpha/beta fold hydrolase [Chloroflexota bacterium]